MEQGFLFSLEVIILYTDDTTTEELPCWDGTIATPSWYNASGSGLLSIKEIVYFWH